MKKRVAKRHKHSKRLFAGRMKRTRRPSDRISRLWRETDSETLHALNLSSPLSELVASRLEDAEPVSDPTLRLAGGVNWEDAPGDLARYEETVGKFKRNEFADLKKRLADLQAEGKAIALAIAEVKKKEPRLVRKLPPASAPILVAREEKKAPKRVAALDTAHLAAPVSTQDTAPVEAETASPSEPTLSAETAPVLAAPALAAAPKPVVLAASSALPRPRPPQVVQPLKSLPPARGGTALGDLEVDEAVADWLETKRGHIELYLHPSRSRDPQDTIFLDYQYPAERFRIDTRGLEGEYRLVASLFAKNDRTPVAQVEYQDPISTQTYKKKIRMRIDRSSVNRVSRRRVTHVGGVLLTMTVFQGGSGDYRAPKPVPGATVTIVGIPEQKERVSDAEGNARIEKVPAHSELLVRVTAPGYHPTMVTIPIFDADVYTPVYLLSRDKVSAVTRYFTKVPQQPSKTLLMGRVFDADKRTPKEEERLALSLRRNGPLYFNALPDPKLDATSSTGLFAFFNLAPTFRALRRLESAGRALLMNLLPDFGYYVELGRGGKGSFRGRLLDPFRGEVPPAKISVVGDSNFTAEAGARGQFEIPSLDLPPGVLTLEVEAPDYPLSWHTVPWHLRNHVQESRLFLMANEVVKDGAASVAKVALQKGKGTIVGGAEASFFRGVRRCVTVALSSVDGSPVKAENGPFPLHRPSSVGGPPCVRKEEPGYAFFNLPAGEYLLKWVNRRGFTFRSHVVRVGIDRVSVVVN